MSDKALFPESWDHIANDYNQLVVRCTSPHAYDLLNSISSQIRSAKTILDVACGTGSLCIAYINMFPKGIPGQTLIMTDLSSKMVSIAEREVRSRLPSGFQTELQFRAEDATSMKSITDNSIDILVSCFGIFLIPNRDAVFSEVKRVLKSGGTFGTTAWTDLPSEMDLETSGFGMEFQAAVGATFSKLHALDPSAKPPPWGAWSDPDFIRKIFVGAFFAKFKVHRAIHTTTFANIQELWHCLTKTSPSVDVSTLEPSQLEEVTNALRDTVAVESEDDIIYIILSSNIVVAEVDSPLG